MGLSRFLNKHLFFGEGLVKGGDSESPGLLFEDGKVVAVGGLNTEGDITGTGVIANTLKFKGSTALTNMWQLVATIDLPAIGIHGSVNAGVAMNVAASGVAVGDCVVGNAVGSIDLGVFWNCAVMSAANIQVRMAYMGSGAYDGGNVPFKFTVIK
jgi:hypothetical protein